MAVRFGHKDVAALLLQRAADVQTVDHQRMEIIDAQEQWTQDREDIAKPLITAGADIHRGEGESGTILHKAAWRGQKKLAAFLLEHDAAINAKDQDEQTPLHNAVDHKHLELVALLIARGAHINLRDNQGRTPMYYA